MIFDESDYLAHYGILRRSGRYPWGSGGPENVSSNPSKRNKEFLDYVADLKRQGLTEVQIATGLGVSTTELRAAKSIAKNEFMQAQIGMAERLRSHGLSNVEIGKRMGRNESYVRTLLDPGRRDRADVLAATSQMLRDQVAEKRYIDISKGVENHIGISNTKLKTAVAVLQEEGYQIKYVKVPQLGTSHDTSMKVLCAPDAPYPKLHQIQQIVSYTQDGGRDYFHMQPPLALDPARVRVRYKEDGGDKADGIIYVRPGVKDVSLGGSSYAQVRIAVGKDRYMKGVAMYKSDLPDGVDVLFNTNKSDTGDMMDALKPVSGDPVNPFGASISRQIFDHDSNGKKRVTSVMNLVNEEGAWADWSRNLPSQFLSKQSPKLAKTQLDMTYETRRKEFEEIQALTNPVVRKKLLETFADSTDSAAVHLKAAALPRQGTHVILPVPSLAPTQVYAPNFRDGERVVLIRFPHGGTFEIPELTVNNNHRESQRLLGKNPKDAIGINPTVAERLSGADFDGDFVLVIPNNLGKIKHTAALEGLRNFDPRAAYPAYEGMPKMTPKMKQTQMGNVSNLITDMTIQRASTSELARAVRHSMVVIDAEKHDLNYKQSAIDNGIAQLKEKYQGGKRRGAATLISRAGAEDRIDARKPRSMAKGGPIDRITGKRVYEPTGEVNYNTGKPKQIKVERLAEVDDAHTLSSGTPIERVYADHSNRLKAMANEARLVAVNTPTARKMSPSAKTVYSREVASLNAQLNIALRNAPLERQAQLIANTLVSAARASEPDMDGAKLKKVKAQKLNEARIRTGASKTKIVVTPKEWEAIQAGAISNSKLGQILDNADLDVIKTLATPKSQVLMTPTKIKRAQQMAASGATQAEIADALGVSLTTLKTAISE